MNKILKIIKREFKTKVLTKGFLIGTILGPIFILGLSFGPALLMNISEDKPQQIEVVDESGELFNSLTQAFDDTLSNGELRFILIPIEPGAYYSHKEEFLHRLEEGKANILLIFPKDIIEGGEITYISKSVSEMDLIQSVRRRVNDEVNKIRLRRAGFDPEKINDLTSRIDIKTIKIVKGEEKEKGIGQEWITSFVFLMILYMTILFYGAGVMRSVLEEKTSKIIEVLLSSSNSFKLMMGKIFGAGSAGLVQYAVWILMAFITLLIASASMPKIMEHVTISFDTFFFFVLFFIIGFFQFATIYAAVGAMCSTQEDAQAMSTPVTILIIIPFIVSFSAINDPTSHLAQILSLIPFLTPMIMFVRTTLVTPPMWEILAAIAINIISILFFTWISAKIYRVGILMYGKRPTVPEIVKWLRYK
jgi:ABC-2 type transport system permease protein